MTSIIHPSGAAAVHPPAGRPRPRASALTWFILLLVPALATAAAGQPPADLLNQARAAHLAGNRKEALALYAGALAGFRALKDDAGAAVCLNNSSVLLLDEGDTEAALTAAHEAVRLRRALGEDRLAGRSLTNSGRALQGLGRLDEAEMAFRQALAAARKANEPRDAVLNLLNIGVVAQAQGRYGDALSVLRLAFEVIEGNRDAPWAEEQEVVALNNRGALYERIGEFRLALDDYSRLLSLVGGGPDSIPYQVNAATILRNLGDPNLALERLRAAERRIAASGARPGLHANLLSNIGLILHLNLRRPDAARPVLERAFKLADAAGDVPETMTIGNYLGALYLDLGQPEDAVRAYRRALVGSSGAAVLEPAWEAHLGMARILKTRGDRAGALRALRTAAALVEGIRLDLAAEMAPRRFLADRLAVYSLLASALAEAEEGGGARAGLRAVERARERLLLAGWRRLHRQGAAGKGGADWRRELGRLAAAATRLYDGADDEALAAWEEINERWEGRSRIRLPATVAPGVALIEYLIAGEESRVYWLTRDGEGTIRLPPEKEIDHLAEDWLADLTGDASGGRRERESGLRLARAVLRPVLEALPPGVKALRVVPDGALWRVPLDALPEERPEGDGAGRLLEAYEVALAPLLSAPPAEASEGGRSSRRPDLPYVFFGPPAPAPGAPAGRGEEAPSWASLPPLPEAAAEAASLRRALGRGGEVRSGVGAQEEEFKRLSSRPIGVLHLATHAVADPIDAGRTGIVFARKIGGEGEAEGEEGFLSVPEILALDLAADLTVLSACSGAVGETLPGGGLDSLAGALIESGSRAVIASLWDVGDAPTRTLVEQFYYGVGRGGSFSSSLREAKIALLRAGGEIGRPRHWAGWVLVGHGEGMAAPARGLRLRTALPITGAVLVAAALWIGFRLRSSRRS